MLLETAQVTKRRIISLTPLIDVVFILLLFFMLSSGFTHWRQMDITAASDSYNLDEIRVQYTLLLHPADEYEFNNKRYRMGNLSPLKQLLKDDPRGILVISAAEHVSTQQLVDFLDNLTTMGAQHLSLSGLAI